jgi:uncharacterized protein YlxW (UPF0749 family)
MKLVCPHCGHDGTPETTKPPLGSRGFNFLADDVVCREVKGFEENGRLRLSGDVRCEGGGGANARIECRSCWQAFPLPEGQRWEVAPEAAPVAPAAPAVDAEFVTAAGRITQNLAVLLHEAVEEVRRPTADGLAAVQAGLTDVRRTMEEVPQLRQEAGSLAEGVQSLRGRMASIESAMGAQAEDLPAIFAEQGRAIAELRGSCIESLDAHAGRLDAVENRMQDAIELRLAFAELQREQQALLARVDAQAEAIRALHSAAKERIGNRDELQAALQKLEQIAGALEAPRPLPEKL